MSDNSQQQLHFLYLRFVCTWCLLNLVLGIVFWFLGEHFGYAGLWAISWCIVCLLTYRLFRRRYRRALIYAVCHRVCNHRLGVCSQGFLSSDQCMNSLFFPSYLNSFYTRADIPPLVCHLSADHGSTHFSVLSVGQLYDITAEGVSGFLRHPLRFGKTHVEGLFFFCELPCRVHSLRLFLPSRWGKHVPFPMTEYLGGSAVSAPVTLIGHWGNRCWCYGTPKVDEHDDFWFRCYRHLQCYPRSFLSIMGSSVYIFVPFSFSCSWGSFRHCVRDVESVVHLIHHMMLSEIGQRDFSGACRVA